MWQVQQARADLAQRPFAGLIQLTPLGVGSLEWMVNRGRSGLSSGLLCA